MWCSKQGLDFRVCKRTEFSDIEKQPDVVIDAQNLEQLVEAPSERLDVELKGWLDLSGNAHRGNLAKALIALANHGGGVAVIGFDTNGDPADNRPDNLGSYGQDAINDVLDRFADPAFHCNVQNVTREADGLEYPVILVPGGHRVPIRSRRGSPDNEIHADRYYIRRPGPASEMPQGGHEWDDLIRRCVRNSTDEIASLVRDVLEGRAPRADAPPDASTRLAQLDADSIARWTELIDEFPAESHVRMPRGHYRVSAIVEGLNLDSPRLREAMNRAEQHLTARPPWWWPTGGGIAPRVVGNAIECHMANQEVPADAAHSDFWRVSTSGELFLIRGYVEDSLEQQGRAVAPGTVFDLTLPIWRIGECLLFIQRFADEADEADSTVSVRCEWTGLSGRRLTVLTPRRHVYRDYTSHSDTHSATITVPVERISGALPEIVRELVDPLYALFDFFQPPAEIYAEELGRMQRREL